MQQLITPNPDIPCTPGWCLQYVRQAFNLPAHDASATEAWDLSTSQHPDQNFPDGCWVPVFFTLAAIPEGHVALRAPDGSVYSSSDNVSTPHHHPNLQNLLDYYAYYNLPLGYLGWTEDVAGYAVVEPDGIAAMGTTTPTTPQEDEMSFSNEIIHDKDGGETTPEKALNSVDAKVSEDSAKLDQILGMLTFKAIDGSTVSLGDQLRSLDNKAEQAKAENEALRAALEGIRTLADVTPAVTAAVDAALANISITLKGN